MLSSVCVSVLVMVSMCFFFLFSLELVVELERCIYPFLVFLLQCHSRTLASSPLVTLGKELSLIPTAVEKNKNTEY